MTIKLRIWHVCNLPGNVFHQEAESVSEAMRMLDLIAQYDLFLGDLIGWNAQGLEIYKDGEWEEWEDDECNDIDFYRKADQ